MIVMLFMIAVLFGFLILTLIAVSDDICSALGTIATALDNHKVTLTLAESVTDLPDPGEEG